VIRYHITDRKLAGGIEPLVKAISRNLMDGVDLVQIREKDMPGGELAALVERVLALPNPHRCRILVNSRVDVAIGCGAGGVHLPSASFPIDRVRRIAPAHFLIGVSCHTEQELLEAEQGGADFLVLSPIFLSPSKAEPQPPLGLERFTRMAAKVRVPVLALGGVSHRSVPLCQRAGAAGVAGISMFQ
jgi:thiamine-phosphate pyrophosphorylase